MQVTEELPKVRCDWRCEVVVAVLNVVVGLALAFGGAQEAVIRGVLGRERASLVVALQGFS
jgi:hypothetical protein